LENIFKKTREDVRQVLKIAGKKTNLYLYFVTDKEFAYFKESPEYFKRSFGFKNVKLFEISDKNKYDPQNRASKAKFGSPGIFLE
jgi:ABC-type Zn2+ transport system substrate-binding protein/surface adhesin